MLISKYLSNPIETYIYYLHISLYNHICIYYIYIHLKNNSARSESVLHPFPNMNLNSERLYKYIYKPCFQKNAAEICFGPSAICLSTSNIIQLALFSKRVKYKKTIETLIKNQFNGIPEPTLRFGP